MIRKVLTGAVLLGLTTAVVAQTDVITERCNIMKRNGALTRIGGQMAKGEIPFDLAKAKEAYADYLDATEKFPKLFPDNSKTGDGTTAAPAIWENKADFDKRFADWAVEIKKAQADTKDLDTFKASFGNVTKACGSCHNVYRVKT